MNESAEWLRYLPLLMLLTYLIPTTWVLLKNPLGKGHSISEHIASSRKVFIAVGLALTLLALEMVAYFLLWVGPVYELPPVLNFFVLTSLIGGLGTAWLPASSAKPDKPKHYWHVASAATWFLSCVAISILFLVTVPPEKAPIAYLAAQCASIIFVWLGLLYALYKPARNHFVLYETIGVATFIALIIVISFKI